MSAIISKSIPETISRTIKPEYVTRSELKSEIEFDINLIYKKFDELLEIINELRIDNKALNEKVSKLEVKDKPKPTPSQKRAEILYKIVMNGTSLNSRQVMHKLGVKQHVQAIRAMKNTARFYSEDLIIKKFDRSNKSYTLMRRIDCSINPYTCKGLV